MADELTVSAGLAYTNTGISMNMSGTDKVSISANFAIRMIYTVSLAGAALPLGSIATPGVILIRNAGANYVMIGNSGDALPIKIKPGEYSLFRFNTGITPFVQADTAPVAIEYFLLSD